jgi:hypothetical protein
MRRAGFKLKLGGSPAVPKLIFTVPDDMAARVKRTFKQAVYR